MDNEKIARRLLDEVWNKGNYGVVDEIVASNYVNHDPQVPEELRRGPEGLKTHVKTQREGAPDLRCTVDQALTAGDNVILRWTATGTNTGRFMGMPATNKRINVTGITINRVQNGKIVESFTSWDMLGLLQQLGFVPKAQEMQQQAGRGQQPRPEAK